MGARPDRPPDKELFGEGCAPPDDVRARIDAAQHAELYTEAMPDETHRLGWWAAKIWLET